MNLRAAISNRRLVTFDYRGHRCVVKPVAYGVDKNTRAKVLRAYQVGGSSPQGPVPSWKLFQVGEISQGEILAETFDDNPTQYRRGDRDMVLIYCEL